MTPTETTDVQQRNLLAYCTRCQQIQVHSQTVTDSAKWIFRTHPICNECGNKNGSGDLCAPIRK